MPYASHRIVGVIELEATRPCNDSDLAALARRIDFDLSESRSTPRVASEPIVKVDSASLWRELDSELANLLAMSCSAQLS